MRATTTVLCGLLLCLISLNPGGAEELPATTGMDTARAAVYEVSAASIDFGASTASQANATDSRDRSDASTSAIAAPLLYVIPWHSLNGGGGTMSGYGFTMNASVAQDAVGLSSGETYETGTGYWYTGEPDTPGCSCPCHADPECDAMTNVLDVVRAVRVAFRGGAPVFDPSCPYERTDVNCSGFTDVIDVVKFVNVAFRGGSPILQFCHPCIP